MKKLLAVAVLMWGLNVRADVRGAAMTPDGMPVENARVEVFAVRGTPTDIDAFMKGDEPVATATTDAKGNFRVVVAKPGNYTLSLTADGYAPTGTRTTGAEDIGGLLMSPAAKKIGRVTANGKPLADTLLTFDGYGGRVYTRTDAQGRYTVPDPAIWMPSVRAHHPGYALYREESELGAPPARLDIAMSEGVTLRGRVLAPDGKSGAKAKLSVDGFAAGESADDGTFELPHISSKWSELLAVKDNLAARVGPTGLGSIRLQRAIAVTGNVVDATTRVPMAGALVLLGSGSRASTVSVTTNDKGAFTIPAVLPGTYSLTATHAGYGIASASQNVTPAYKPQTVYMNRDIRVSGTVTDESRRPVSGASVRMSTRGRDFIFHTFETHVSAADGRYALRIEPSRAEVGDVDIEASKRGRATTRNGPHKLRSGDDKTVDIVMTAGVPLTGRVTSTAGEPLAGVAVATRDSRTSFGMMMSFLDQNWTALPTTDAEGRFSVLVQPGTYSVVFHRAGYAAKGVQGIVADAESQPIDVKLDPAVSISGRVVTAKGEAVVGATVHATVVGPQVITTTDSTGAFILAGLAPEFVNVYVSTDERDTEERRIKAPAENVTIELTPTITVSGRVTTKAGAAVPDFTVELTPPQQAMSYYGTFGRRETFHDTEGRFALDRIPARPLDLVVSAPGYGRARLPLKIEKAEDLDDLDVKLERAGSIAGRVTTETGAPIEGVRVMEQPRGGVTMIDWQPPATDADGEYRFEDVPLGKTTITFRKNGFQNASRDVTVEGSETRLDVQMAAGKVLSGRVVTEEGTPIADVEVRPYASSVNAGYGVAITDSSGRFTFDSLGPGVYRVTARRAGYVDAELADVNLDTTSEITLTMSTGATVTGHVTGVDPARYADVAILIGAAGKRVPEGRVDAAGNYRVQGVPAGKIGIRAVQRQPTSRNSELVEIETQNGGTYKADIEFREHNIIRGRVTVRGVPVRAGSIFFRNVAEPGGSAGAAIDENGQYEAAGVRSGDQNVIILDTGADAHYSVRRTITHSGTIDFDLNPATVSGRIMSDATDEPLAGALVTMEVADASTTPFGRMETRSGADGRFVIQNVAPGKYAIRVTKEKFAPLVTERVVSEGSTVNVDARLIPSDGLTLRVIDSRNGRPVSGFVSARNEQGVIAFSNYIGARPDGSLDIPLAPGMYRLNVFVDGLAAVYVTANSPGTKEVVLRPGGTLEIATTKKTAMRGLIRASDGTTYNVSPGTPTDDFRLADGTLINDIATGSYTLEVTDTATGAKTAVPFVIREGQTTKLDV